MLFQNSLGIDVRKDRVSIVYLKTSFKGIRLSAHATCSLEISTPINEKLDIVSEFVGDFMTKHHVDSSDIFLGIPDELTILRDIKLPLAARENLRSTLKYEMEKYIPLALNDIYYDCQIIEEDKTHNFIRVLLSVIKKKDLDPYLELRNQIKGGISGIEITSMGLADFLIYQLDSTDKAPLVFVYGSNNILEIGFIRNSFLNYSKSVPATEDRSGFNKVVKREIDIFKGTFENNAGTVKLALCGTGLSDLSEERLKQLKIETGLDPFFLNTLLTGLPSDDLASTFGHALKGLKKGTMQINLLPDEFRKKPSKTGYFLMMVLSVLVVLSGLAWGSSQIIRERIELNRLNDEIKSLTSEVKKVEKLEADISAIEGRIDQLNMLRQNRAPMLDVLKELSERIPESAYVQNLSLSKKEIQLSGFAQSASELISLLEASPFFEDVVFLSTITKSKDGKERFRIGLKIK